MAKRLKMEEISSPRKTRSGRLLGGATHGGGVENPGNAIVEVPAVEEIVREETVADIIDLTEDYIDVDDDDEAFGDLLGDVTGTTSHEDNAEDRNITIVDDDTQTDVTTDNVIGEEGTQVNPEDSPHQCSICLEDARLAVVTNCVHVFCSNCLLEVWRRSSQLSAISCPYCRQRVTLLLPYFTQEENYAVDPALAGDRRRLVEEMTGYNRRNSGEPRSVMEQLRDLPMLLRHLLTRLITGEGLPLAFRVRIMVLVVLQVAVYVLQILFIIRGPGTAGRSHLQPRMLHSAHV